MNPAPTNEPEVQHAPTRIRITWAARITGALFLVVYVTTRDVIRDDSHSTSLRVTVGVLLAITLGYAFWKSERDLMANNDELEQKIRVEAMAMALPLVISLVFLLGVLAECGVPLMKPTNYWLPILYIYIGALAWSRRRYR
jgi:hypothetical protein